MREDSAFTAAEFEACLKIFVIFRCALSCAGACEELVSPWREAFIPSVRKETQIED